MRNGPRIACALFVALAVQTAWAQWETLFTYQGHLTEVGAPANGTYDIGVTLWDASLGGNQIGSEVTHNSLAIVDGKMNIGLDFGVEAFDAAGRWLQIRVNGTTLAPRQPVSAAPYAIETRGIQVNPSGSFVGVGRSSPITSAEAFGISKNTSGFGGMYVQTTGSTGDPFYGYSAGGDVDAYHAVDGATGEWYFANPGGIRMRIAADGDVEIGGNITMGPYGVRPPYAYGYLRGVGVGNPVISLGTSNIVSATRVEEGVYEIEFVDAFQPADGFALIHANSYYKNAAYEFINGKLKVTLWDRLHAGPLNGEFSFLVYRAP